MTFGTPPSPFAYVGADGTTAGDVSCKKCGYNVRGLPLTGRCPECGTPVGVSVQGDLLRYCNPTWVRALQRGARLIIAGVLAVILGLLAGIAVAFVAPDISQVVNGLATLLGYILVVIGSWLLTEPDPSGLGEDQYGTSRKIIRISLGVGVLNVLLEFIIGFVGPVDLATTRMYLVVSTLFTIVGLVGLFAQLQYLKKLSLRLPDVAIAGRAQFLTWAITISYGTIILLGSMVAFAVTGGGIGAGLRPLGCVMVIVGIALIVFLIMYLLMIAKLGRRFGEAATEGEETWAGATHPPGVVTPASAPPPSVA